MTPRELIASEIARQYPASADGPTLADRILTRLRYAGFVVVPRIATPEMVEFTTGACLVRPAADNGSDLAFVWAAMIAAAENT